MALYNTPIKNSFIQLLAPVAYGDCDAPQVCLPMVKASDLSFQLTFLASGTDFNYFMQIVSGALGKIGAIPFADGVTPPNPNTLQLNDFSWFITGVAPTGNVLLGIPEWVVYFQPNANEIRMANIEIGQCFNIYLYYFEMVFIAGNWTFVTGASTKIMPNADNTGQLITITCFTKVEDSCEAQPTSILQYVNNSDCFGFFYDQLPNLVDNINFVNSIRLPLYLHSPEQSEDQMSYAKSNGSTLKLSHRIWTDYKLKTDRLTAEQHLALVAATAHDLVFIECEIEGISLGGANPPFTWVYDLQITQTQFVRTEKINVEWQQADTPRYKLGKGEGTVRLALAASNTNSNCQ